MSFRREKLLIKSSFATLDPTSFCVLFHPSSPSFDVYRIGDTAFTKIVLTRHVTVTTEMRKMGAADRNELTKYVGRLLS